MRSFLALVMVVAVVGCKSDDSAKNAQRAAATTPEDRIKQIQNTPGMPDAEKARIIDQIQHAHSPGAQ